MFAKHIKLKIALHSMLFGTQALFFSNTILSKWCPLKLHFNTQTIPSCWGRLAPAECVSQHFPYSTINIHDVVLLLPKGGPGFIFMNSSQLGLASFTYYPTPELWFCSAGVSIFPLFYWHLRSLKRTSSVKKTSNPRKLAQGVYKINF